LPAEQVVWLVIGMGLFRGESIERVVDALDIPLPDRDDTAVAKSAVSQARQRLPEEPLAYLFETTAAEWATRSAEAHRWRGLTLYGMDGTTMRVPDSPENRLAFGGQRGRNGESGYPQVRLVALMALRSHVLAAVRFSAYSTGETTLAREVWSEIPEDSLTIVDRNFLVKKDLIHLETSGNRQDRCPCGKAVAQGKREKDMRIPVYYDLSGRHGCDGQAGRKQKASIRPISRLPCR
jgi:hypothetical protein